MTATTEVILCTFNGENFLVEQLQSILDQTLPVDRISIYDDRSTDNSIRRIEAFIAQQTAVDQSRFEWHVNSENLGYAKNFMSAIERSTADVLFLCDQDDVWEPSKVEVMMGLLKKSEADLVFSDGSVVDRAGKPLGRQTVLKSYGLDGQSVATFQASAFERLIKQNYINGAAMAVRRTAAQAALPLPCDMPHDYWLAIWCSLHGGVMATSQALYRYRQHASNAIGMGSDNPLYRWLGIWRQPIAPRQRELRIWQAVSDRIASIPRPVQIRLAKYKLLWLTRVVSGRNPLRRMVAILVSGLQGRYRAFSPEDAFWRDLLSLIK